MVGTVMPSNIAACMILVRKPMSVAVNGIYFKMNVYTNKQSRPNGPLCKYKNVQTVNIIIDIKQSEYFTQRLFFLDLNIKVIGSDVHTFVPAFTTNTKTSDFLLSISPGWLVMFLDYNRKVFTFFSWFDLLSVFLAFWISILKYSNHFQTTDTGL